MVTIWVEGEQVHINQKTSCAGYGTTVDLPYIKVKDILKLLYYKIAYNIKKGL